MATAISDANARTPTIEPMGGPLHQAMREFAATREAVAAAGVLVAQLKATLPRPAAYPPPPAHDVIEPLPLPRAWPVERFYFDLPRVESVAASALAGAAVFLVGSGLHADPSRHLGVTLTIAGVVAALPLLGNAFVYAAGNCVGAVINAVRALRASSARAQVVAQNESTAPRREQQRSDRARWEGEVERIAEEHDGRVGIDYIQPLAETIRRIQNSDIRRAVRGLVVPDLESIASTYQQELSVAARAELDSITGGPRDNGTRPSVVLGLLIDSFRAASPEDRTLADHWLSMAHPMDRRAFAALFQEAHFSRDGAKSPGSRQEQIATLAMLRRHQIE